MKQIFLYGLANVENQYRVVRYICIDEPFFSISDIRRSASWLRMYNPTIEHVYAVDNRGGLAREYKSTVRRNTIASNVEFKDLLEREGIMVL